MDGVDWWYWISHPFPQYFSHIKMWIVSGRDTSSWFGSQSYLWNSIYCLGRRAFCGKGWWGNSLRETRCIHTWCLSYLYFSGGLNSWRHGKNIKWFESRKRTKGRTSVSISHVPCAYETAFWYESCQKFLFIAVAVCIIHTTSLLAKWQIYVHEMVIGNIFSRYQT